MTTPSFAGVGTAMLTPFAADGSVDLAALAKFVEFQISGGVNFLVPCGTTGESVTMTLEEQADVIRTTMETANGRVPVLAGCGGNDTAKVIKTALHFKSLGVTHILSVSPYYNKPTQEGLYQHYKALAQETDLQVMLYSVQGRTASNVEAETVARLADEGLIFGIKEASGNILQMQKIVQLTGPDFQVLSGDDAITQAVIAVGGVGVISVASNIVPRPMRDWLDALLTGDFAGARKHLARLLPLFEGLFIESSPGPVKGAASLLGLMEANFRLPMVPPTEGTFAHLKELLKAF